MNKNGQVILVTFMIGIVFIIFALAVAPAIKQSSDIARNQTTDTSIGLDCSNSTISKFDKTNCVVVDLFNPYFIGFVIAAGGAIIAAKLIA